MKVFIWEYVRKVSTNYHEGGGLVVFAETEQRAREIANATDGVSVLDNEAPCDARDACGEEKVFVFPDAGCC